MDSFGRMGTGPTEPDSAPGLGHGPPRLPGRRLAHRHRVPTRHAHQETPPGEPGGARSVPDWGYSLLSDGDHPLPGFLSDGGRRGDALPGHFLHVPDRGHFSEARAHPGPPNPAQIFLDLGGDHRLDFGNCVALEAGLLSC